jgi:hypothetical protein
VCAHNVRSPHKSCSLSISALSKSEETVLLAAELETNQGEIEAMRSEKRAALNEQCCTLERFQSSAEKYDQSDWERKRLEK